MISITGGGSTQIVAIGRPHLGAEVAAYNGFTSGGTTNYLPMLFRGQWGYDAAFYVQNISGSNTTVSVDFYDVDGNYTCTWAFGDGTANTVMNASTPASRRIPSFCVEDLLTVNATRHWSK